MNLAGLKTWARSLDKLSRQALAIAAAGAGAILILYIWLVWLPLSSQTDSARKNLLDIKAKINRASQEAQKKPRLDEDLARLRQAATEASQRLPQNPDIPAILVTASELASQYKVQMLSFVSQKSANKGFYNELDFQVSVHGTYNGIGRFLAALALQERIFNVANVVYGGRDDSGEIPAHFTLIAYQYKG